MGCCGQKRLALKEEMRTSTVSQNVSFTEPEQEQEQPPRVFEYTGNETLALKGVSSGTIYYFRYKGERIEVNYFDSFALMAERDLKIAR